MQLAEWLGSDGIEMVIAMATRTRHRTSTSIHGLLAVHSAYAAGAKYNSRQWKNIAEGEWRLISQGIQSVISRICVAQIAIGCTAIQPSKSVIVNGQASFFLPYGTFLLSISL